MSSRLCVSWFLAAAFLSAHPMGNFSVSHYTNFTVAPRTIKVIYVLDLAEVPTFELLKSWKLDPKSPKEPLAEKATEQSQQWMHSLDFTGAGKRLEPKFDSAKIDLADGSGGLATARITSAYTIEAAPAQLQFEDKNYRDRNGWKEISIHAASGAQIIQASQTESDRARMLTGYPAGAPPQDLRASFEWRAGVQAAPPKIVAIEQPPPVIEPVTPAPATLTPPAAPGELRSDYLANLLGKKEIGLGVILIGMLVALGFGAMHALSPGHGKTIVAAYLVGSRGTFNHAIFLGAMVTFTHTISVFAIGLATLFLSRYIVTEKIIPVLGAVSGLSIVAIGASLFFKRLKRLRESRMHLHQHRHGIPHHHHRHSHAHDHGDGVHTHVPEGDITLGSLIALGASGGLVPCPSALVLLLSSIALGHVGVGLILLVAFSLGLAGVLIVIGMLVLYAKNWLPDPRRASQHPAFRLVPVLSALVIVVIGLVMTGVSLGWVRPGSLVG